MKAACVLGMRASRCVPCVVVARCERPHTWTLSCPPSLLSSLLSRDPTRSNFDDMASRTRTTSAQRDRLNAAFRADPRPDHAQRAEIAHRLGMTPRCVQVWFQNRRAKFRGMATDDVERAPTAASSPTASTSTSSAPPSPAAATAAAPVARQCNCGKHEGSMHHRRGGSTIRYIDPRRLHAPSSSSGDELDDDLDEEAAAAQDAAQSLWARRLPGARRLHLLAAAMDASKHLALAPPSVPTPYRAAAAGAMDHHRRGTPLPSSPPPSYAAAMSSLDDRDPLSAFWLLLDLASPLC